MRRRSRWANIIATRYDNLLPGNQVPRNRVAVPPTEGDPGDVSPGQGDANRDNLLPLGLKRDILSVPSGYLRASLRIWKISSMSASRFRGGRSLGWMVCLSDWRFLVWASSAR